MDALRRPFRQQQRSRRQHRSPPPSKATSGLTPLLSTLLFFLIEHQGSLASRSPSPILPTATVTLQGKLAYRTTLPIGTWVLAVNKSDAVYRLPWQPVEPSSGEPIPPASWISLTCDTVGPNVQRCTDISDVKVIRPAAPSPPPLVDQTLRLLVMTVNLSASAACGGQPGMTDREVLDLFIEPNGLVDFFGNCSFGKMVIDTSALTVVSTLVPCSREILSCDQDAISLAARKALPPGIRTSSFTHLLHVVPMDIVDTCRWVGLADVPGTQTWFAPDLFGILRKATVMQEILHNFGLYHGWRNGAEYNDLSTPMGYGESCPSAPELWRLGWATPLAQLNSSTFPPHILMNFTLPATALGPKGVMVRIQPDWLEAGYTKNVYVAFRIKAAGDSDLLPGFNRKLNIHELSKDIDNDPSVYVDPRVSLIGVMNPGTNITLTNYKLFIVAGAILSSNTSISVQACRFTTSSRDCADGQLLSPPSSSPSSVIPLPPPAAAKPLGPPSPREAPSPRRVFPPPSSPNLPFTPPTSSSTPPSSPSPTRLQISSPFTPPRTRKMPPRRPPFGPSDPPSGPPSQPSGPLLPLTPHEPTPPMPSPVRSPPPRKWG